ncbi:cation diffusion facilitator family transporter [Guyparkeria halophila]|uniref:Cation diffusion facilitator family transporter n=1 Tax=Guyparkeria halophila TaxID=47960 RepID=A0ABZ0YYC9_9GAMM|nr:cation diffusion facilitator family transporter [Guyparkeria halophila]WQH17174.1 cation diffusion facilitator family transporter [Guyparkeria halophila]
MKVLTAPVEIPDHLDKDLRRAYVLEGITVVYGLTVVTVMYLVMGSSQAMKAAWLEDLISLIPPIVVLVGLHMRTRRPSDRFPYGFHRVLAISFQVAALALSVVGLYVVYDAATSLLAVEHPTIGTLEIFGHPVWLGWLMLPALLYSALPASILGRLKLGPARALHNKAMVADAAMNKADWMTSAAAGVGILGIGFGFWWADSVAALVIGLDVLMDGVKHLRTSVFDLMDRRPNTVDGDPADLPRQIQDRLADLPWVRRVDVRMREAGQIFFGEAYVEPVDDDRPIERTAEAIECARSVDWRMHDLTVQLVRS